MYDSDAGDELPTYDSLAAAEGHLPNSRFGRWREWVEKRANERALGSTEEQKLRRRKRGWGESTNLPSPPGAADDDSTVPAEELVDYSETLPASIPYSEYEDVSVRRLSVGERISQSHASLHTFGSRFIPHADCQIHCVLPLMSDRFLLLGTDDGLSVLDLLPELHGGSTSPSRGGHLNLGDAKPRKLWIGESIHQLTLLEDAKTINHEDGLKGVVLALVGVDSGSGDERKRTVRMYNLSSLCSLIAFVVNQPDSSKTLNLSTLATLQVPSKKTHRASKSITKGILSLVISDPSSQPTSSRRKSCSTEIPIFPAQESSPATSRSSILDNGWDMVEELPMRWATDYVPLAPSAMRNSSFDVTGFELYRNSGSLGRLGPILAVALKTNILIFEAPLGERAFRFVKDLYTPCPVTHLTFVELLPPNSLQAPHSEKLPRSSYRHSIDSRRSSRASTQGDSRDRDHDPILVGMANQAALFVSFEKRAAVIRLSDATVQEVNLYDDPASPNGFKDDIRTRPSSEGFSHAPPGIWLPTIGLRLPRLPFTSNCDDQTLDAICVLTKGKRTQVLRSPLPTPVGAVMPLVELRWHHQPAGVSARVIPDSQVPEVPWEGILQLMGFGPAGVEVLEIPISSIRVRANSSGSTAQISSNGVINNHNNDNCNDAASASVISTWGGATAAEPIVFVEPIPEDVLASSPTASPNNKGKGKNKTLPALPWDMPEPVRGYMDIGSDTMFLSRGGRWHEMLENGQPLSTSHLTQEDIEMRSAEQEEAARQLERDSQGVYACAYRGGGDFRIFYVGNFVEGDVEDID